MNAQSILSAAVRQSVSLTRAEVATLAESFPATIDASLDAGFSRAIAARKAGHSADALFLIPCLAVKDGKVSIAARNAPAVRFLLSAIADGFKPAPDADYSKLSADELASLVQVGRSGQPDGCKPLADAILKDARDWACAHFDDDTPSLQFEYISKLQTAYDRGVSFAQDDIRRGGIPRWATMSAWSIAGRDKGKGDRAPISVQQRQKAVLDAIALLREHPDFRKSMLKPIRDAAQ